MSTEIRIITIGDDMSNLTTLLLRATASAIYQTKGSTLSFAELDQNLILLANCIMELMQVPPGSNLGIPAYSSTTEYSQGDFVTFGNNIWEYINATPTTGNTPAEGAFWSLRSAGIFAHQQNTDTGTNQNTFSIGDGAASDKVIRANTDEANKPQIRWNDIGNRWEFSNDGLNFFRLGLVFEAGVITTAGEYTPGLPFTQFVDIELSLQNVNIARTTYAGGVITFLDGAVPNERVKLLGYV